MGRPAKFKKEDAIAIAMEAIWAKGYEGVSVSELASAMSITRSSFYNCFKTREALFEDVLAAYVQTSPDYFLAKLPEDAPIVPAIREAVGNLCHARANDPDTRGCLLVNCLAQACANDDAAEPLVALLEAKIGRYEHLLERAQERGEFNSSACPRTTAEAIVTHMVGINMMSKLNRSEEQLWAISDHFLTGMGLGA